MGNKNIKNNIVEQFGQYLFIGSLVFYCILKLPFNLSVTCSSSNEGFHFVYGQYLLNGHFAQLMLLFDVLYSFILKIFGFGTVSIIAIHFIQMLIVILSGILIFVIVNKLLQSHFFSGIAVMFWILIQLTPIGGWGWFLEFESAFALEAELIIVLFSLCSIYLLTSNKPFWFVISGLLAACLICCKTSGAVFAISVLCWLTYFLLFDKKQAQAVKNKVLFFLIGFIFTFFILNLIIYFMYGDLRSYWGFQFSVGSYSKDFLQSPKNFLLMIHKFMTRGTPSISNFLLFFTALISIIWGLVRSIVIGEKREDTKYLQLFYPLLSIWSIGNICTIIASGVYGSYYYILVWASVSIFLTLGIRDLFKVSFFNNKPSKLIVIALISVFFFHRLSYIFPGYLALAFEQMELNFLFHKESFQDPVIIKENLKRPAVLRTADFINNLLPDKNDTFYILNISKQHQDFSPSFYIYTKRLPPTIIFADFLQYPNFIDERIKTLTDDLTKTPPKILIIPDFIPMLTWQEKKLNPFLTWLKQFIVQNYSFGVDFRYLRFGVKNEELYHVYKRNAGSN